MVAARCVYSVVHMYNQSVRRQPTIFALAVYVRYVQIIFRGLGTERERDTCDIARTTVSGEVNDTILTPLIAIGS